jgi:hypothetical protein
MRASKSAIEDGYTAGDSPLDKSRRFGGSARIGWGTSPKHVAAAIIEDQKATHKRAGMTMFSSADRSL